MEVLIPIETSSREMIYKIYLCHHLVLKGFNCYLGSKSDINYLIKNLNNYIYIDKGYHKGVSEEIYESVRNNNGIIVNLDEEGGVDYSDGSTLLGRYSKTLFDSVDFTFIWGEKQFELIKNNMNQNNKYAITGHPRFELLKPEFHSLYQDKVKEIKKRLNEFILINTNMGFGNNIKGDDFVKSNYGDRFKNINQIISFYKKKLKAYQELIINLSQQLNRSIVLRPHPEENSSFYQNAFKGIENVHVIYEGSVVPWILASDLMIHADCTTAIESLLLGKRPISYLPKDYDPDYVTSLPLRASRCFESKNDLIKYINNKDTLDHKVDIEKFPFINDYFSYSKSATHLIVENINNLKNDYTNSNTFGLSLKILIYLKLKSIKSRLSNIIINDLVKNKLNSFNPRNIIYINKKIINRNISFQSVKCRKLSTSLYLYKSVKNV